MSDDEVDTLLFGSTYTGGAFAEAGDVTQAVLDLTPGQWLAAGGFEEPQPPVYFNVAGEMPDSLLEPSASATITMADYSFAIAAGQLTAGPQVIKVENAGSQPHHIYMGRSTVPLTDADLETIAINPDEHLSHVVSIQTISAGNAVWLPITLSPGPHVLFC
ncbi:MAG TPA: hypothetical protein VD767_03915 [Thermomicrobiales bacterium]|nr:hypothetical protein [Thermomicrobiales bacterium]